jgi:hypothetical protein
MNLFYSPRPEDVWAWLNENVEIIKTPKELTLHSFKINWKDYTGTFRINFGCYDFSRHFQILLEGNGTCNFVPPLFHSPLGVPCTYNALKIDPQTIDAIREGLSLTLPRVKPLGICQETGQRINFGHPIHLRVDPKVLKEAMNKVDENYSITVQVNQGGQ